MIYSPELYYFFDTPEFDLTKAVRITAEKVAEWSFGFEAELLAPKKGVVEKRKSGRLSADSVERKKQINESLDWIAEHSIVKDLFKLILSSQEIRDKEPNLFDHHDDTCCWCLNISVEEFSELQKTWQENDLPVDLFYSVDEAKCVPSTGFLGRLLGATKCYTPLRWKNEQINKNKKHAKD